MKKAIYYLVLGVFLMGCSSTLGIWAVSEEGVRQWPDSRIHGVLAGNFYTHPDSPLKGRKEILKRELFRRNPGWSQETQQAILDDKLLIGMTPDQVRAAWGSPHDINTTVSGNGTSEQWIFTVEEHVGPYSGGYNYDKTVAYAYFENGKLTSWQH